MSDQMVRVSVRILEKEYQVACLPEERSELLDSAEYLNTRMREIRDGGNVVGLDRIAVMAALNITNELLKVRGRGASEQGDVGQKIRQLRERVETALTRGQHAESVRGQQLDL
jgi:cell division protein ZapA